MDDCDWMLSVEKACDWLRIEPGVTGKFFSWTPCICQKRARSDGLGRSTLHSVPEEPADVTTAEELLEVLVSPLQPPLAQHLSHHPAGHLSLCSPLILIFL